MRARPLYCFMKQIRIRKTRYDPVYEIHNRHKCVFTRAFRILIRSQEWAICGQERTLTDPTAASAARSARGRGQRFPAQRPGSNVLLSSTHYAANWWSVAWASGCDFGWEIPVSRAVSANTDICAVRQHSALFVRYEAMPVKSSRIFRGCHVLEQTYRQVTLQEHRLAIMAPRQGATDSQFAGAHIPLGKSPCPRNAKSEFRIRAYLPHRESKEAQ